MGGHDVESLLREFEEDSARCEAEVTTSVEQETAEMEATQEAADELGSNAKTWGEHSPVASMRRKFERFLEKHGPRLGYVVADGATLEIVEEFVNYCSSAAGREYFSAVGRKGQCDKYFELHLPSYLARGVFPMMGMPGWTGLSKNELRAKAAPFTAAIHEKWQRIKNSRADVATLGASLHKVKWEDGLYFLAQDHWMALADKRPNEAAWALAVMGFVRVTCSRSGSMGRDWFDRRGLTTLWLNRNVLSVSDFTWDKEHFVIELPQVSDNNSN